MENIKCPKCGSEQITANKKGFSGKNAVAGALVTGGIGLLAGTIGSNKVKITCLKCGHVFNPGDKPIVIKPSSKFEDGVFTVGIVLFAIAILVIIVLIVKSCV